MFTRRRKGAKRVLRGVGLPCFLSFFSAFVPEPAGRSVSPEVRQLRAFAPSRDHIFWLDTVWERRRDARAFTLAYRRYIGAE